MRVPRGCRFVPAPMRYFVRFDGANGLHAGILPGYPASHGCVRLPDQSAIAIFNAVDVGTPVTVFGRYAARSYELQFANHDAAAAIRAASGRKIYGTVVDAIGSARATNRCAHS